MTRRQMFGVFNSEEEIISAIRLSREKGYKIIDVYTPYAVHGLDRAMGLKPSRLPWATLALGVIGASFKVWFEFWTTAVDWPINIGGKPFNSLPAFVPVTFEVMVLLAGVGTVITFLFICKLFPGKRAQIPHQRVTSDKFVILLEGYDASFDEDEVRELLKRLGAVEIIERIAEGGE